MLDGYTMDVLEQRIGYCFHNKALLKQALTHSSYTNEQKINKTENYERIEFLGDAVLELVSSDFLFREHPDVPEGELTKMRASMVCEPSRHSVPETWNWDSLCFWERAKRIPAADAETASPLTVWKP